MFGEDEEKKLLYVVFFITNVLYICLMKRREDWITIYLNTCYHKMLFLLRKKYRIHFIYYLKLNK